MKKNLLTGMFTCLFVNNRKLYILPYLFPNINYTSLL